MLLPPEIAKKVQERFDRIKAGLPGALSTDRTAIMVDGSIGYGCYVSPDGDVFVEEYDVGSDEPPTIDRSRRAQISLLVLGSRTMSEPAQLLPRPPDIPSCGKCDGVGRVHQEHFHFGDGQDGLLCDECFGLGWLEA
jgi:hypothetical protein